MINIVELSRAEIYKLEEMWLDLNQHHYQRTSHFKEQCAAASFDKRFSALLARDRVIIYTAEISDERVGYCTATVDGGIGEIDSLYVKPLYRGADVGNRLCEKALAWLRQEHATQINVQVAEGNEEVMRFYENFGFRERSHLMRIPDSREV